MADGIRRFDGMNMTQQRQGRFVRLEDYEALRAENDRLRERVVAFEKSTDLAASDYQQAQLYIDRTEARFEGLRDRIEKLAGTFEEVADKAMDVLPLDAIVDRLPAADRPRAAAEGTLRMAAEELRSLLSVPDNESSDEGAGGSEDPGAGGGGSSAALPAGSQTPDRQSGEGPIADGPSPDTVTVGRAGDHSCHEGCGCQIGSAPTPDFEGGDNQ